MRVCKCGVSVCLSVCVCVHVSLCSAEFQKAFGRRYTGSRHLSLFSEPLLVLKGTCRKLVLPAALLRESARRVLHLSRTHGL